MSECMHDPAFTSDGICSICHRQRLKLIAFHANHLHQCGWCGEWYTGARVDHGCPAPCHVVDDYSDESEDIDTDLSAADIIDMEERTAETSRAEDYDEREGSVI